MTTTAEHQAAPRATSAGEDAQHEYRPLFGNQLRWAKRVILDSLAQYKAKKAS